MGETENLPQIKELALALLEMLLLLPDGLDITVMSGSPKACKRLRRQSKHRHDKELACKICRA